MSNTANWPLAMSGTKACQTISGLVKTRGHLIMLRHAIGWNLRVCLLWLTGVESSIFSTHPKSSRSGIDKRTARATGNTRYRYSKIAPLDHKMADNCVSLARTNTLSSTITKPIKTSKTSNKSYSYSLLNCINKMYTHDLFYLQQEWEAWLAPVYKQIQTTKSQLTQCTKY